MQEKKVFPFIVMALLAGFAGSWIEGFFSGKATLSGSENGFFKESTYDRVMRTQTIRCGYYVWPPFIIKDTHDGKISGLFYDYLEAIGDALHLKIDWAEEVGTGDITAALETGRVDAICAGTLSTASRALRIDFVTPVSFLAQYVWARDDDRRFDNHIESLNDPSVTLATMDGAISSIISAKDFPKAKTVELPQLTAPGEILTNVIYKKADVAIADPITAAQFIANNPGKLRRVPSEMPLRVFGDSIVIARGQGVFRRMLDTTTQELLASEQIEKIIAKYEQYPGTILRVAPGYRTEQ